MAAELEDRYKDGYVVFIDLLGFKAVVDEADTDSTKRTFLLSVLHMLQDTLCENPRLGMRLSFFSDCLVASVDRRPECLYELIVSISTITLNLLQQDVLVRGGLAAGGVHHEKTFLYGRAVNEAYGIESNIAKHPVTLLSPEVAADAERYGPALTSLLYPTEKGPVVDYLGMFRSYRPYPPLEGMVILDRPAARIVSNLHNRLTHHTGSVLQKAEWLKEYWNFSVQAGGNVLPLIDETLPAPRDRGDFMVMIRRIAG